LPGRAVPGKNSASQNSAGYDGSRRDGDRAVPHDPPAPPLVAKTHDLRGGFRPGVGRSLVGQAAKLVVEFRHWSPPVRCRRA